MALRFSYLFPSLLLATATAAGHAAELGDARVLSHIGQALVADVELTLLEEPARQVAVRLANPDVYRGANIAMPAVLSSLSMHVTRRDGRQFLHLTSLKPVESRHLHVYLELADGSQPSVRLVTLWLTPDPNPAPLPAPAPLPVREAVAEAPKAAPPQTPAPAPTPLPVPVQRPAAALHAGEEYVEAGGAPTPPAPRTAVLKFTPKPAPNLAQRKKAAPAPLAAVKAQAEAPGCAPQPANDHLNACVALGEKNAALHQQLGTLEEKVKTLQGAAGSTPVAPAAGSRSPVVPVAGSQSPVAVAAIPAAALAAPAATPAAAAKEAPKDAPKGAPRIQRKPKKAEPPAAQTPWLLIGAGLVAVLAIGALVLALLRRRKHANVGKIPAAHKPARPPKAGAAPGEGEPKPNFMAAVKARLMPGRGKGAAPMAAPEAGEPVLNEAMSHPEQGAHESSTHP